jgi:hypothetical protein
MGSVLGRFCQILGQPNRKLKSFIFLLYFIISDYLLETKCINLEILTKYIFFHLIWLLKPFVRKQFVFKIHHFKFFFGENSQSMKSLPCPISAWTRFVCKQRFPQQTKCLQIFVVAALFSFFTGGPTSPMG